jgi:hypothetical protein
VSKDLCFCYTSSLLADVSKRLDSYFFTDIHWVYSVDSQRNSEIQKSITVAETV